MLIFGWLKFSFILLNQRSTTNVKFLNPWIFNLFFLFDVFGFNFLKCVLVLTFKWIHKRPLKWCNYNNLILIFIKNHSFWPRSIFLFLLQLWKLQINRIINRLFYLHIQPVIQLIFWLVNDLYPITFQFLKNFLLNMSLDKRFHLNSINLLTERSFEDLSLLHLGIPALEDRILVHTVSLDRG